MPRRRTGPGRWWTFAVIVGLALTAMAAETTGSRRVADRFLVLYYDDDQARVREAARLCTGDAKARIDAEIKFMAGASPDPEAANRPPARFALLYQHESPSADVTYVYRVHFHTPDVPALFAKLVLVQEKGQWLVKKFVEKERDLS
jgi:hypothetical protein